MRVSPCLFITLCCSGLVACTIPSWMGARQAQAADDAPAANGTTLVGKTQPSPGKRGIIAPVVLHPVTEVLVSVGDTVKKEQALVKIDDDEPQADVRTKQANLEELKASLAKLKAQPRHEEREEARALLESAKVTTKEMQRLRVRLEELVKQGATSEQRFHEVVASCARAEADEKAAIARLERLLKLPIETEIAEMEHRVAAAQASLEAAKFELEHYTVTAGIAGVVSSINVSPGEVSRPGTTIWGEILDLSVIDVRCDLSTQQVRMVSVGQEVRISDGLQSEKLWPAKVASIGIAADPKTGLIPILIRMENTESQLRCYVDVKVHIGKF